MVSPKVYPVTRRFLSPGGIAVIYLLVLGLAANAQPFTALHDLDPVRDKTASRSVNWIDIDNDGDLDLFVSNGLSNGQNNQLYRNAGPPSFKMERVSADPIVTDMSKSDGSTWGDYDNDGDPDLFVVNWYDDNNMLFQNQGDGAFLRSTQGDAVRDGGFSETASWGDYDNDGYLDLAVANSGNGQRTGPMANFLYHNDGRGSLVRVTSGSPIRDRRFTRGVNWVDVDDDGDLDLFAANESSKANDLYFNQLRESGKVRFVRLAIGDIATDIGSSWSGSWGDYDNDGDLDLFVANWDNQDNRLYRNEGKQLFTTITRGPVVNDGGYSAGSAWIDYDNDGDLDLFVSNAYGPERLVNFLYRNTLDESGTAEFERVSESPLTEDGGHSYGFSWGDYDNDGDLDIHIARTYFERQPDAFYRNDNDGNNAWLQVACAGTVSNRSGIGAKIKIKAVINGKSVWQRRDIAGQDGYCSQNLRAHFGLGDATTIDSLVVSWPSGRTNIHVGVAINQILKLTEQ